jgi:hypothetical protein
LGNKALFTLKEDAPAPDASSQKEAHVAERPGDSLDPVAEAVERTVHALVDAGEGAWSHAKTAWDSRWGCLEEEDEDGHITSRRQKLPQPSSWQCGEAS